jgi:cytochrome c2
LKKKKDFNPVIDFYWLFISSVIMFCLMLISFHKQANPEWKKYQQEFKEYLEENISPKISSSFDFSVKQIWLPELNKVDRCISCHLGYDNPNLVDAPEPFTAHPDIEPHSLQKMGCTICHGGQGFALKKNDAHGEIEHWEEPLLGKKLANKYGLKNESELIQIKCNVCHRRDENTPGMEIINLAKKLLTQKNKCQTCHIVNGKGGRIGPDLTFIGDKPAERFDFSQIKDKIGQSGKPLSMLSWHFKHFMNPAVVVPDSKMPSGEYTEYQVQALALLMMSWKNINLPIMLIPKGKREEPAIAGEEGNRGDLSLVEWGKELFENMYCSECHTIGEGVEVGPDLKGVTKRRDGQWLKRMILTPLEMEQMDSLAIELYREYDEIGMETEEVTAEEAEAILKYIESFDKN